jgi:hypothetical protein
LTARPATGTTKAVALVLPGGQAASEMPASPAFTREAAAAGAEVTWVEVRGDTHAMLLCYRTRQRLAIRFTLEGR